MHTTRTARAVIPAPDMIMASECPDYPLSPVSALSLVFHLYPSRAEHKIGVALFFNDPLLIGRGECPRADSRLASGWPGDTRRRPTRGPTRSHYWRTAKTNVPLQGAVQGKVRRGEEKALRVASLQQQKVSGDFLLLKGWRTQSG
jgi:hypothetical protein